MVVNSFEIRVNKSPVVYAPGEVITGNVFVSLNGRKSCRGIKLKFEGNGRVYWPDNTDYPPTKEEHYLRKAVYVVGNSDAEVELVAGQHVFPFACPLPPNIPNTFHHDYGKIEYTIKAVLEIPCAMDYYAHLRFRIYSPLNLSQAPSMPIVDEVRQQYSYCLAPCISNGSMEAQIRSPSRTLEVGEQLEVFVDIDMRSESMEVMAIVVQLKQTLEFHAESRTKSCSKIVQLTEEKGPFRGNTSVKLGFQVPRVYHSGLQHCSIIRIKYCLGVRVITPDCYSDIETKYDITIGYKSIASAQYPANCSRASAPSLLVPGTIEDAAADVPRPHPSANYSIPPIGSV